MSTLAALRSLVYTYVGTASTDPAYPSGTVNTLLNAVGNRYVDDIHQMKPDYLVKTTTLTTAAASHAYTLPSDFAGFLEVRLTDATGWMMTEVRHDELNLGFGGPVFSITGPDGTAILTTADSVTAANAIYLRHRYTPVEMAADTDVPTWMPSRFHDLLAREAAIDAYGLGNESQPAGHFIQSTEDRRAQFWYSIGRRGVQTMIQRR